MLKKSIALLLVFVSIISLSFACTIIAVGKDAMADGSTIITHSCDQGRIIRFFGLFPRQTGRRDP